MIRWIKKVRRFAAVLGATDPFKAMISVGRI